MIAASMADTGRSSSNPYFSTTATMALAVALMVPLAIRTTTTLEPYPALLFPGAGGTLSIEDGKAIVHYLNLYGRSADGQLEKLNEHKLLTPIPAHYLWAVAGNTFGQDETPRKQVSIKRIATFTVPRRIPSPEDRRAALAWIATRAHEEVPRATALVLRIQVGHFDLQRGEETSTKVLNEVVVPLP